MGWEREGALWGATCPWDHFHEPYQVVSMGHSPKRGHRARGCGVSAKCSGVPVITTTGQAQLQQCHVGVVWKAAGVAEPQAASFVRSGQSQDGGGPSRLWAAVWFTMAGCTSKRSSPILNRSPETFAIGSFGQLKVSVRVTQTPWVGSAPSAWPGESP